MSATTSSNGMSFYIPRIRYSHTEQTILNALHAYLWKTGFGVCDIKRVDIRRRKEQNSDNMFKMAFIHFALPCEKLYNAIAGSGVNITISNGEYWMMLNYTSNLQDQVPNAEYYDRILGQYEETHRHHMQWLEWYAYHVKHLEYDNAKLRNMIAPNDDGTAEKIREVDLCEKGYCIVSSNEVNAKGFPTTGGLRLSEN